MTMNTFEVLSINVGKPQEYMYQDKLVSTAIWKSAIDEPVMLSSTNIAGDGQADLINHGGLDKAVMVYSYEHYGYWEQHLQQKLAYGAFGENVTIEGLTEHDVCIGDTFQWGEAIVQISQPRYPCYKLSIRHGLPEIPQLVLDTGFTGYYVRVLKPGIVSKDAPFQQLEKHSMGVSVSTVSEAFKDKRTPAEVIREIMAVDVLSESWK